MQGSVARDAWAAAVDVFWGVQDGEEPKGEVNGDRGAREPVGCDRGERFVVLRGA